jgi:hypothetical protein
MVAHTPLVCRKKLALVDGHNVRTQLFASQIVCTYFILGRFMPVPLPCFRLFQPHAPYTGYRTLSPQHLLVVAFGELLLIARIQLIAVNNGD